MTKDFKKQWPIFLSFIDKSPKFRKFLEVQSRNTDGSRDKNLIKGKDSARIRFAVLYCMKHLKDEEEASKKAGTFEDISVEDME